MNKEELPVAEGVLLYQFTGKVIKLAVVIIKVYQCYQL
jgi:hypothetical protein